MKKTEIIAIVLGVAGLLLAMIPDSAFRVITYFTFTFLVWFYFILSFAILNGVRFRDIFKTGSFREISVKRRMLAIFSGWVLSLLVLGIIYKISFLPGADFMLLTALSGSLIILLLIIITKPEDSFRIYRRILFFASLGLTLYLIPMHNLIRFYYRSIPELAEIRIKMYENPLDPELNRQYDEIINEKYRP